MKSVLEKEKIKFSVNKIKKLKSENPDIKNNIEKLNVQKNQLKIEKQDLEENIKI